MEQDICQLTLDSIARKYAQSYFLQASMETLIKPLGACSLCSIRRMEAMQNPVKPANLNI